MINSLAKNLVGYDGLIFILAIINLLLFLKIQQGIRSLDIRFKQTRYLQNELLIGKNEEEFKKLSGLLDYFTHTKELIDRVSGFYYTITSIFPLLGILGTVIGLLNLSSLSSEVVANNFSLALTSTFWGILFAAICKIGEGFFTPRLEAYDKLYLEVRATLLAKGDALE